MSIRVLVADDQPIIRAGIVSIFLGTEYEVMAQAEDMDQAVRYTLTCNPDLVLMDLRMPGGDCFQAIEKIKTSCPAVRVVVHTAMDSVATMVRARQAGADGFLVKGTGTTDLMDTIHRVVAGERGWSGRQLKQVGTAQHQVYGSDTLTGLTEREVQVLERIGQGRTNEEIAEDLAIDQETVKQHVKHLLKKLGVEDRTQAALWKLRYDKLGDSGQEAAEPPFCNSWPRAGQG
jgi:DNA-binding NarL/FixJ family response regulator